MYIESFFAFALSQIQNRLESISSKYNEKRDIIGHWWKHRLIGLRKFQTYFIITNKQVYNKCEWSKFQIVFTNIHHKCPKLKTDKDLF